MLFFFLILEEIYQLPVFEYNVSAGIITHGLYFVELHFSKPNF